MNSAPHSHAHSHAHAVAIIGGATAGAEVASRLAERGLLVAVFEQNLRPYGKIEDGLPAWHVKLRHKEYETIVKKLSTPGVHFVPQTCIGRDIAFPELVNEWGFSAVVLANGAWKDRALPVEGADAYVGKGLVYQNPFVIAFNHLEDPRYDGETFEILDDTIIVGGGLASIDVAKIHTLGLTQARLAERGIEVDIEDLEVKGIPKILARHGIEWSDLGIKGSRIYYRRRIEDMPLMSAPENATPEQLAKTEAGRLKMFEKARQKYFLEIEPLCAPDGLVVEDDRLVGLRFRRTKLEGGRVVMTDETFERRGSRVISSIGSIPQAIEGIEMKGELFAYTDWELGRLADYPSVFSVGNVVTGKGNIVASRKHATRVSRLAIESYLGVADEDTADGPDTNAARATADSVTNHLEAHPPVEAGVIEAVAKGVQQQQAAVGYSGDLESWLAKVGEPS
jgi:NADPH-dependent glutamate synthase beta subunit-like oxidoreductase